MTGWIDAAAAVGVAASAQAQEIERRRSLTPEVVAGLVDAGLCKLLVPTAHGGGQVEPAVAVAVTEALAFHDGATAWCQMIAATTGLLAGFLPSEHAAAVFGPPDAVTGGFAAPMGTGHDRDSGGITVSGRWAWGSGTDHCTTIGGGTVLADRGFAAFAFFDRADVELLDTWHVAGLRGTGSTDYVVDGAVVPEGRWASLGSAAPVVDEPLYRFSLFGLLALGVASVALGLGRRAITEAVALAASKRPQGSAKVLAERPSTHAEVAAADAELRSARAFVDDVVGRAWSTALAGHPPTLDQRADLRLAATHSTLAAARVVDRAWALAGGAAVYESHPLQRVFRDVHVATQHAMVAPRTLELAGRIRLGLDTDARQL